MRIRSGWYRGEVLHHRFRPVQHRFVYRVDSCLFDVDELELLASRCRWFSLNRFNLYSFYYRDFATGDGQSPREYLDTLMAAQELAVPARAELLCYPRILGFTFNPLAVYYCYDAQDRLYAVLYEVSNTFGQRHSYLIPAKDGDAEAPVLRQCCDKGFYVSPFIPMQARYHFRLSRPGERLSVAIRETDAEGALLHAVFRGRRRPFSDRALLASFARLPLMTLRVVVAIHWQALKLYIKGMRVLPRPAEPDRPVSRIDN